MGIIDSRINDIIVDDLMLSDNVVFFLNNKNNLWGP